MQVDAAATNILQINRASNSRVFSMKLCHARGYEHPTVIATAVLSSPPHKGTAQGKRFSR